MSGLHFSLSGLSGLLGLFGPSEIEWIETARSLGREIPKQYVIKPETILEVFRLVDKSHRLSRYNSIQSRIQDLALSP